MGKDSLYKEQQEIALKSTKDVFVLAEKDEFYLQLYVQINIIAQDLVLEEENQGKEKTVKNAINYCIQHNVIPYLLECFNNVEKVFDFIKYFQRQEEVYKDTMTFVQAVNALRLDEVGDSILHYAIKNDYMAIISDLLDCKVNCNVKNKHGDSILHTFFTKEIFIKYSCIPVPFIPFFALQNFDFREINADGELVCIYGHLAIHFIKFIISKGFNISVKNNYEQSLLHCVLACQNMQVTEFLYELMLQCQLQLECGIDFNTIKLKDVSEDDRNTEISNIINATDYLGRIPLHYAVEENNIEAVAFLLSKNNNVNTLEINHQAPLHFVKTAEMASILIDKYGADINLLDIENRSAIGVVLENFYTDMSNINLYDCLEYFIKKTPFLCTYFQQILIRLHQNRATNSAIYTELLQLIRTHYGFTDYHIVALLNDISILSFNQDTGLDINAVDVNGYNALHFAISFEMILYLVDLNIKIDCQTNDGLTLLHRLVLNQESQSYIVLKQFLEFKGIESSIDKMMLTQNNDGYTPLHFALKYRSASCADMLLNYISENLELKSVIKLIANNGFTALHFACKYGYFEIAERLIKLGACVRTESNAQLLHIACNTKFRNINIVELLINKGLDEEIDLITEKDNFGRTPLFYAVKNDDLEIVQTLLCNSFDNIICDYSKITPLHFIKSIQMAVLLPLSYDNISFLDKMERTPFLAVLSSFYKNVSDLNYFQLVKYLIMFKPFLCSRCQRYFIALKKIMPASLYSELLKQLRSSYFFNDYHLAAFFNDISLIKEDDVRKINECDANGFTALYFASQNGHLSVVEYLLGKGADINAKCECNKFAMRDKTSLHVASQNGHLLVVEYLLRKGADINAKYHEFGKKEKTALIVVAEKGFLFVMKFLIARKADVDVNEINSCLLYASHNGHSLIVDYLLANGLNINLDLSSALYATVVNGHCSIAQKLIENGADINAGYNKGGVVGKTILHLAAQKGYSSIVAYLIDKGADVNAKYRKYGIKGKTALHLAAKNGHVLIIEYLLKAGVDVNVSNNKKTTALHVASQYGDLSAVKCLVTNGANVNVQDKEGATPLMVAVENGHLLVVTYLVEHGADIDAKNKEEATPLIIASEKGHASIAKYLATHGAYIDAQYKQGKTSLYMAVKNGHEDVVGLLNSDFSFIFSIGNGVKFENGCTAMHVAAKNGQLSMIKALVCMYDSHEFNAINSKGRMPLHMAAKNGHLFVTKYLIKNNALVINARDNTGKTPLQLALEKHHFSIVNYLISQKAYISAEDEEKIKTYCK